MIQINLDTKMPESCADCLLEGDWDSCPLLCEDTHLFKNKRHPDCPLMEVTKCEDCEYYNNVNFLTYKCKLSGKKTYPTYGCPHGKGREE